MPSALFLCSGTGSVGEPFREAGWVVWDVDWDGRFGAEIQADITTWNYKDMFQPGEVDVVWASPDCTQYSIARTRAKRPRSFEKADKLVQACIDIIDYLQPRCWFIENPNSGYLKTRAVVDGLRYVIVDFCMYGALYRKRTRLWTNCTEWAPKLCDRSHLVDSKHAATAQKGNDRCNKNDIQFTTDQLHRLPRKLCDEVFSVCELATSLQLLKGPEPYLSGKHPDQ